MMMLLIMTYEDNADGDDYYNYNANGDVDIDDDDDGIGIWRGHIWECIPTMMISIITQILTFLAKMSKNATSNTQAKIPKALFKAQHHFKIL